ncbi:MAG: LysR family transcriptional regulator [Evtepia gabavorous]
MELRKLVCFLQICTCDSLSQAGRRLYMSQQGVSRLVHSLETELGVPLFYRGAQGIKLTEEGKLLKKHAEPLCREYQLLLEEIEAGRQAGKPLRLGITSGILFAAQDGLTSLEQQNITLIDTYDDLCDEMVLEGSVSMGIGVEPVDHPALRSPSGPVSPYLICWAGPSNSRAQVTFDDLAGQHLYLLGQHYKATPRLRQILASRRIPNLTLHETGYMMNIYRRCQQTGCVGLAVQYPNSVTAQFDCTAIPLREDFFWEPCLLRKKGLPLSPEEAMLKRQILSLFP